MTWQIEIPAPDAYILEFNYASPEDSSKILLEIDRRKWSENYLSSTRFPTNKIWESELSSSRYHKKQRLQKGKLSLALSLLPFHKRYFELHSIRLIPISLESKIMRLRNSSYFGMNLYDMELAIGKAVPVEFDLEETCKMANEDPAFYGNLNLQTTAFKWIEKGETITASFLNDKCIAIHFKSNRMDDILKALKETQRFYPKSNLPARGIKKEKYSITTPRARHTDFNIVIGVLPCSTHVPSKRHESRDLLRSFTSKEAGKD